MSDDEPGSSTTVAQSRGRRSLVDKSGRQDALEKLKNMRSGGVKHKYEVKELENVYELVDESTYSRHVHDRQKDDWIVDDGDGIYVEDGREIFDDDLNDHDDESGGRKKSKSKKEKAAKKAEKETHRAGFQNVRDMLSAMPVKRKRLELSGMATATIPQITSEDLVSDVLSLLNDDKRTNDNSLYKKKKILEEVIQAPHTLTPSRSIPQPTKLISIKKKKFVPFAGARKEPSYECPSQNCSDEPIDDEYHLTQVDVGDMMREETPPPEIILPPKPKQNGTNQSVSSEQNTKMSAERNTETEVKVKELIKIEKKFSSKESFGSYGLIEETNTTTTSLDSKPFILEENSTDGNILNFFWLDMFEEPRNPGVLYLFGKVQTSPKTYSSACVVVKDLTRSIHLLIRETMKSSEEEVKGLDVYNEFDQVIAPRFKINEFKSRPVRKKYCFDLTDVPYVGNYVEVRYPGSLPAIPQDLTGETFSHVFGSGTPLMETFLLEKKLKGPSWLQIKNPKKVDTSQQHSWSKLEFTCSVSDVRLHEKSSTMDIPPVVLASINIQATNDANTKKDTIVFIGVAVHRAFKLQVPIKEDQLFHDHFCLVNKPLGEVWPLDVDQVFGKDNGNNKSTRMESERAMLGCLLAKLQQIDADLYLGHDLNFDLLLLHLLNLKVPHWSRLGRLKRTNAVGKTGKTLDWKSSLAGRLFCDVKVSAMELIRARSYDFPSLVSQVLGKQVDSLTGPQMKELFGTRNGLQFLINWGMEHTLHNIRLVNELQVMPLALQITSIAGNTLFRTLLGGRSERNEYLLLHAFYGRDYIVPDKYRPFQKKEEEKKGSGPSYAGGMVLDPKKGFYDKFVVLMDFNSLYPSIIQEFNICFTASMGSEVGEKEKGVLPEEIRKLVESRRQVKGLMSGPKVGQHQLKVYDIRQKALKLTANSMYGCLGFRNSRFYAKDLAAKVTGYGRDILVRTKEAVEGMGYEVIYGDTDSLMINSNTTEVAEVYKIGNKIKAEINKMYKLLELEIDGVFRFLLLLKKKKYAALLWNQKKDGKVESSMELKGLDMVRRDWAPIASNSARLVLDEIMSEQALEDKVFKILRILEDVAIKLRSGDILLGDLLITKQLAKNPEEYKEASGLYHVSVALRMNKAGNLGKKFKNGDTVPYLFCTDGLPHHLSELSSLKNEDVTPLQPDPTYYLAHQIHPVVSRICEPMEGLDASRIAEALGMDPTSFKRKRTNEENEDKSLGQETETEKYIDCQRFSFHCPDPQCKIEIKVESLFVGKGGSISMLLSKCPTCNISLIKHLNHIGNRLRLFLRNFIRTYYKNEYICEDPTCDNVERGVPFSLINGYPPCGRCKQGLMCKDYRDAHLYKQLSYIFYLFDIDKQIQGLDDSEKDVIQRLLRAEGQGKEVRRALEVLKAIAAENLEFSGYSEIKLGFLFQSTFPKFDVSILS